MTAMAPISSSPKNFLLPHGLLFFLLLLFFPLSTGEFIPGTLGITYNSHTPYQNDDEYNGLVAVEIGFRSIWLSAFDAASILQFSEAPSITMHLEVNSTFIAPLASNKSFATPWITDNLMTNTTYGSISVGYDAIPGPDSDLVLAAIKNLRSAWLKYPNLPETRFSTAFSFKNVIKSPNPPSAAEFDEDIAEVYMLPLLEFLNSTKSAFMIDLFPYEMVVGRGAKYSRAFALFEGHVGEFVFDDVTGCVYTNLFDLMYDAVVVSMMKLGYKDIPIIVTGTGWPGAAGTRDRLEGANDIRSAEFFGRMTSRVNSGKGSPLRLDQPLEVFYHSLYDLQGKVGEPAQLTFGITWPEGYLKYHMGVDKIVREFPNAGHELHFSKQASLVAALLSSFFYFF